jgi:2-isopropylmalate synthase
MPSDSADFNERELVYDWNIVDWDTPLAGASVEFDDETLRDGLQSPSITHPTIEQKIELLHLMVELGIQSADIGLPGAGERVLDDVTALAKEIADQKLPIEPNCAARTLEADVKPVIEASQKSGCPIEVSLFIGSSPIRQYVENWTLDQMLQRIEDAINFTISNGLSVMFVTEDTTRAHPDMLRKLYSTAIRCGARRLCVADTVGHATPHGTRMLIKYIKEIVRESGESVKIDWHGHKDRGLSLENSIAAVEAGADRVHGTALGIGERCGNAHMELLLVNFKLLGVIDNDLTKLGAYCALASKACDVPIPFTYPVVGRDAYRTSTGVHAAAVIKAMKKGHGWLADRIYSGVPASWTGCQQQIEIGPMSGASNVIFWLQAHGVESSDSLVQEILQVAKEQKRLLTEKEILQLVQVSKAE